MDYDFSTGTTDVLRHTRLNGLEYVHLPCAFRVRDWRVRRLVVAFPRGSQTEKPWLMPLSRNGIVTLLLASHDFMLTSAVGLHCAGSEYEVQQLMADAGDVDVPITVVARRGLPRDGGNPLLLHGYGAYGMATYIFCVLAFSLGNHSQNKWVLSGPCAHTNKLFTDRAQLGGGLCAGAACAVCARMGVRVLPRPRRV